LSTLDARFMRYSLFISAYLLLTCAGSTGAWATGTAEPKTEAAVLEADEAWGEAEQKGNADFVDRLLLPGYRSVSAAGIVTGKDVIVEHTRKQGGSPERAAKIKAWKAAHPLRAEVKIAGDTAILSWISAKPETADAISSCDIFVYTDGHWRAIYSQHTQVSL
jgi:hypothetical protein